eukprot:CAMPEP_0167826960 /NCGR_PEP_ID=MMETSP0112_2-20121227/10385_1 /TAXON_ID=91324 /ORGANISM="Lotharella globosa, Strain CCCM811" /LENGTH=432 /DNA_ID=CAMNT_0007729583 /DNA_START=27 /DNA_END=1322 /DNA_ORIENTATION=-
MAAGEHKQRPWSAAGPAAYENGRGRSKQRLLRKGDPSKKSIIPPPIASYSPVRRSSTPRHDRRRPRTTYRETVDAKRSSFNSKRLVEGADLMGEAAAVALGDGFQGPHQRPKIRRPKTSAGVPDNWREESQTPNAISKLDRRDPKRVHMGGNNSVMMRARHPPSHHNDYCDHPDSKEGLMVRIRPKTAHERGHPPMIPFAPGGVPVSSSFVCHDHKSVRKPLHLPRSLTRADQVDGKVVEASQEQPRQQLAAIAISGSGLRAVPPSILFCGEWLQHLDLSHNRLESIPRDVARLNRLKWLNLSVNYLSSLPEGLDRLSELEDLNLDANNFVEVPLPVTRLPRLKSLSVRFNCIRKVPPELARLAHVLETLRMDGNHPSLLAQFVKMCPAMGATELDEQLLRRTHKFDANALQHMVDQSLAQKLDDDGVEVLK